MKVYKLLNLKYVFLLLLCCSIPCKLFSQKKTQTNQFWENVRFSGGFGLSFGDGFFSGTLTPGAIYQFNENLGIGLRVSGTYNSLKNAYNSTIFGTSIISIFNPIAALQLSSEFEYANVNQNYSDPVFQDRNYWVPALYLGLGYRTTNIVFGIRYDALYDRDKSIYADPLSPFVTVFF